MKKSIFLFFAALLFSASAWADWCGNSFITVNGLWCTGSNSHVHDGGYFHGKDLGTLTTFELGGEFQVWPSSTTAGTLCYKIDDGTENSISLPKTGTDGNNSKHSGSGAVDLSGLAEGSHSIAVWFTHGSDIDNNGGSNYVATFTIAAAGEEPEPVADVTVHFINTPNWAEVACHHWIPNGAGTSWPGDVLSKTDEIAGYDVYTATFTGAHTSCIFNNNNNGKQTGDLTVNDGKYYEVNTNTWYADKAAAEAALATPIPDETVYLINTGNWSKVMIYTWNGVGGTEWPGVEMTPTGETIEGYAVYSYTAKQGGQANLLFQESENVNKTGDLTWEAGKYYAPLKNEWYDTKEAAAEALAAPVEYDYVYLINTNDWAKAHIYTWIPEVAGWPGAAMTLEAEQIAGKDVYSYKVVKGTTFGGLNFNCGGDECKTGDLEWQAGKYYAPSTSDWYADAATAEAALAAVVTYDYYITGSFNGDNPNKAENGMTLDGTVYKATVTLAADDNTLKVTDGTWNNTWGYNELGAAYEEVSNPNDYNNIKITLAEEKEITVIFDATAGKITFEGLTEKVIEYGVTFNVTVPEGTEACYICGAWDWNTFKPMTKVDDTHYTLEIAEATKDHGYKYTCGEGWEFVEKDAEGNDLAGDRTWSDNDVVAAWPAPAEPVEMASVVLMGVDNDWTNGIEMELNPYDANEYMLLCQSITADEPIKIKAVDTQATLTWCAKLADTSLGTVVKDADDNENIVLEEGKYDFYYKVAENEVWIGTCTETEPEYMVVEDEITNFVFDMEAWPMVCMGGPSKGYQIEVFLVLTEDADGTLSYEDCSVSIMGQDVTLIEGTLSNIDPYAPSADAVLRVQMGEEYYELHLAMSAAAPEPIEVVVENATVTLSEYEVSETESAYELIMIANWTYEKDGLTYEVECLLPTFDPTNESGNYAANFYVRGDGDAFGMNEGVLVTVTKDGNNVTLTGNVSALNGNVYNVTISGTLPTETPDYTRPVAYSSYGTICLPNGSSKVEGAKFYEVTYKKDGYIYADEVTTLVAGMPYIFQATSTEIKVYYNETTAAAAGSKNGVYGTFSDITDGDAGTAGNVLEGKYLLVAGPKVQKCGGNCSLKANRAYFVVSEITTNETQPLPGRKRIALGCQEENQATGLDNITENGIVAPAMQGTYDILGRQLSEPAANGFYIINGKKMFVVK